MCWLGNAWLALKIALFAAIVPLLFRLPLRRLDRLTASSTPEHVTNHARAARIIRFTDIICNLGRPLITSRCQTRGLTLFYFLRRAGVDAALVFGVGQVNGKSSAHCWLERDGVPYLEKVDPRQHFTAIYSFGPKSQNELAAIKRAVIS